MSIVGKLRRASFQTQLGVLLGLAVVPMLLFLGIFAVVRENALIRRAFEQKSEGLVDLLAYNLAPGVEFEDVKALSEVVAGVTRNGGVTYVLVSDPLGRVLASFNPAQASSNLFLNASETKVIERVSDAANLHLCAPLMFNQRRLGTLQIAFSLERINQELYFNFLLVFGTLIVTVLVIVILTRRFAVFITEPIESLKRAAEHISKQEFDFPAQPMEAAQEVEFLNDTFNQMVQAIRTHQTELRELNSSLEVKVQERTRELEFQTMKAQLSDRLKSEFLSNMSHELRTPLTSILAWPDFIVQFYERRDDVITGAREIKKTATHLLRLINDLLDLESIDAGRMRVDLNLVDSLPLAREAVQHLAGFARQKQVEISDLLPEKLPKLLLDSTRFKQVLINLLSNAIKFSPAGRSVVIEAAVTGQDVTFSIRDRGVGIAPKDLPVLFERFRQVDGSLRRKFGGSGIGLYLVKRLSEMMKAKVTVRSQLNEGSSFSVSFPIPSPGTFDGSGASGSPAPK